MIEQQRLWNYLNKNIDSYVAKNIYNYINKNYLNKKNLKDELIELCKKKMQWVPDWVIYTESKDYKCWYGECLTNIIETYLPLTPTNE